MITETLQIRFTASPIHEPKAWFLPGESPDPWLTEICTWDIPHSALELLVVPHSKRDPKPMGVLVLVQGDGPVPAASRSYPYGQLAGRLYLPVEARLEPAVTEEELRKHLAEHRQYVWHPTAGLVGFDPAEILSVSDLLLPQSVANGNWNAADPGIAYAKRLVAIEAIQPLSVGMILEQGQDDIGTESESLDDLPPSPDEKKPAGPLGKAGSFSLRPVAALIHWLTSRAPKTASGETWIDRLQKWANHVLSPEHQSARQRELSRLLNMLKNDPDKGLKYAIPMGGDPGRGIAPPSTVLSTHEVDFHFSSSGGPSDYWNIPPVTLQQLTARYRELADREIRLGRHRRAAYIYAELLGQMESAAAALKSGGYFREAATVYEERLNRPHDAAACLEEGGLWDEALQRYEQLGEFESCGKIYRRLGQDDQAQAAYRKAALAHVGQGDFLRAAKLYDEECHDSDAALVILRRGWPIGNQAQECLRAEFRLRGREGRHAEAGERVGELIGPSLAPRDVPTLAEVLAEAAGDYPDELVRTIAADGTRVIVSQRLVASGKSEGSVEEGRLLRTIEKLAPEDRLLQRDCERYLREHESMRVTVPPAKAKSRKNPEQVGSIQLSPDIRWYRAEASNKYYFAVGYRLGEFVLVRGGWNLKAQPQLVSWKSPVFGPASVFLAPSPNDTQDVWVQFRSGPPLPPRRFQGPSPQRAITPPWTTRDTIALAQTAGGYSWTVSGRETLVLSVYSSNHVPIITRQLSVSTDEELGLEIPIHARSEGIFLGLNDRLVSIDAHNPDSEITLGSRITELSGSAPNSRVRIAASFEEGGVVFWKDTKQTRLFGHGLYFPRTAFTLTGKLIAADESRIEVYGTGRSGFSFESTIGSPGQPVSVMSVGRNRFAILCSDGRLSLYLVPE